MLLKFVRLECWAKMWDERCAMRDGEKQNNRTQTKRKDKRTTRNTTQKIGYRKHIITGKPACWRWSSLWSWWWWWWCCWLCWLLFSSYSSFTPPSVDKLGDAHHKALNVAKWQMVDMECGHPHCLCRPSNCPMELGRIEPNDGGWKMNAKRAADSNLSFSFSYNISNGNSKNTNIVWVLDPRPLAPR